MRLDAAFRGPFELRGIFLDVGFHVRARKRFAFGRSGICRLRARGSLLAFFSGLQNRVRAVCKAFQRLSCSTAGALIAFESPVDAFQRSFQGHTSLLPGFHDRPVQWRDEQVSAALLPEVLLNLREIIEIVPGFHVRCARHSGCASVALSSQGNSWLKYFAVPGPRGERPGAGSSPRSSEDL